jgi:hypothetical protein
MNSSVEYRQRYRVDYYNFEHSLEQEDKLNEFMRLLEIVVVFKFC